LSHETTMEDLFRVEYEKLYLYELFQKNIYFLKFIEGKRKTFFMTYDESRNVLEKKSFRLICQTDDRIYDTFYDPALSSQNSFVDKE